VKDRLAAQTDMEVAEVVNLGDGDLITVGGIVASVARRYTRKGEPYALFRLEDLAGGVSVVAFPGVFEQVPNLVETDAIVLVKGRVDLRGRELQLRAVEIRELDVGPGGPARRTPGVMIVDLAATSCTNALIAKLKDLFGAHPGSTPVLVRFISSQGTTPIEVGSVRVDPAAGLLSELRLLLGPQAARLEDEPSPRAERAEVAPVG
jgi:DNA polymerase-3 subunit alpha